MSVGVANRKLHVLDALLVHVIDRVAAAAAYADYLNDRRFSGVIFNAVHDIILLQGVI